jgi:phenylalanyl-tRNA synthetase alpha chain
MNIQIDDLPNILATLTQELRAAQSAEAVEAIRVKYLGRNGTLTLFMQHIKTLSLEEKREQAPRIQQAYREATDACALRTQELAAEALQHNNNAFDATTCRAFPTRGGLHPYTLLIERIEDISISLGWSIVSGPEIEDEFHNFEALNIPAHHPARDMQDTFWLPHPHTLLRTHTSTIEIRTLEQHQPPLAICAPGRVFRHEATDATHDFSFMQCEGLVVDRSISLADLIGTLQLFLRKLFDKEQLSIRVRPSYFPFVEPGLEVDISCPFCKNGCSICKKTGWIELGGAGLSHPNVLRACKIDPEIWSGFAFGFGIDRIAMMLFQIPDVRLFKTGRLDVLSQFSKSNV